MEGCIVLNSLGDATGQAGSCDFELTFCESEQLPFVAVTLAAWKVGRDMLVTVVGGEMHLGCAVVAVPRPSLADVGASSATSSVLNVVGHKDDAVCRSVAERVSAAFGCTVVCTGGIHVDDIRSDQIAEVVAAVDALCDMLVQV